MSLTLSEIELRVLGVLIEKSLAHPGSYPLTANSVQLGASQKQNRDPVLEFSEAEVLQTLKRLESKGLVKQASPASGARVYRFEHRVVEQLHWDRREQAVIAELILRGRQTAGELRTRAARMTRFDDLEAVGATLSSLRSSDPPYIEELPREPGRSANRFRHLLSAEGELAPPAATASNVAHEKPSTEASPMGLSERVEKLEERVDKLTLIVESLQKRMGENVDGLPDKTL